MSNKLKLWEDVGFPEKGKRLHGLDSLKIVAAYAVVMTHVASIGWQVIPVQSAEWFVTSVYEIATRFCVPAFFMCTGALLLNPRRTVPLRSLALKYIVRTALIALFVSAAYCMLESLFFGWDGWMALLRATLDGPYFIWYLWVLVGLYALTPLLRLVVKAGDSFLEYAIALLAFFVIGKSTCATMIPDSAISVWMENFILFSSGAEGLFYFLLGAWLVSHKLSSSTRHGLYLGGLLCVVFAIAANYQSALANGWDLYYVNRGNALIAVFSAAVFVFFQSRGDGARRVNSTFFASMVSCGLLIYLVHPFVRLTMESMTVFRPAVDLLCLNPLISIPIVSTIIWFVSFVIALAVKGSGKLVRHLAGSGR